jgi:hypothetical protein
MKTKVGVLGSAADTLADEAAATLRAQTETLGACPHGARTEGLDHFTLACTVHVRHSTTSGSERVLGCVGITHALPLAVLWREAQDASKEG